MTSELRKIIAAKREFRRHQAALPIAEKLRRLDDLWERARRLLPSRGRSCAKARKNSVAELELFSNRCDIF
jgi:hypothetical protein